MSMVELIVAPANSMHPTPDNLLLKGISTSLPSHRGLLYVKPHKTASSTWAGVSLRIARNEARRTKLESQFCDSRVEHGTAIDYDYRNRNESESFLWSSIRDPTRRFVSYFFHFRVSKNKEEPKDSAMIDFGRGGWGNRWLTNYYLNTLAYHKGTYYPSLVDGYNQILQDCNFLAVTERLDESVVVLHMLLRGSEWGCVYIIPSFVSPGMKEYFQSQEWLQKTQYDTWFHKAVNRSLDLTIDKLGRAKFERRLDQFRSLQALAASKCITNTTFPCSPSGAKLRKKETGCLHADSGCGYSCLNQVWVSRKS